MAKLVLLRGNSGSGKTSAAKALQEKFGPNTMLISHDMVRLQILNVSGALGREKSLPLMIGLMQYGRQHSEVTILDDGRRGNIQPLRRLVEAASVRHAQKGIELRVVHRCHRPFFSDRFGPEKQSLSGLSTSYCIRRFAAVSRRKM